MGGEVTGDWRKLHAVELRGLRSSSVYSRVQIKKNEMGGACSVYKEEEKCVDGFGGES